MDIRPIDANALIRIMNSRIWISAYDRDMTINHVEKYSPTLSLNTLRDEIYADAVAHGLWEKNVDVWPYMCHALIREEADELYDAAIEWEDDGVDEDCPDERFVEELADVIITCFSVAGKLGIDIDAAIRRKMEINKNRPWKHGKE